MTIQSSIESRSVQSSTARLNRPSARGICFWYEAVHVAKALGSRRYRIGNFIELVRGGTVVIGGRFPRHLFGHTRAVCCLRPLVDRPLARTLMSMRQAGIQLVADYDDLIFAGDMDGLPASVGGSSGARTKTSRLEAYASGLRAFDRITVSTRALARHVTKLSPTKRVAVIPNGISEGWVRHGQELYSSFRPFDPLVIRYLCGSPSHDADFASIFSPLGQFLRDHSDVCLDVVGPVRFDTAAFPPGQVRQLPSVPYEELPRLLASSWVTLAPLLPNPFNECKSAIKFLESGAFACPTLASPNDDLLRHQELGAPLAFCQSERDWYEQLTSLRDMERRMAQGRAAAHHVATRGMAGAHPSSWLDVLEGRG